ncbi:MAG: hypothetical protein WC310_01285 [Patescibacteria group bacterium]|jgi:hypothetical protein
MDNKFKSGVLVGLAIALVMIICCSPHDSADKNPPEVVEAVYLGMGLWRIDIIVGLDSNVWQELLLNFMQKHADLQITAMYSSAENGYGNALGMFLVTAPKCVCQPLQQ